MTVVVDLGCWTHPQHPDDESITRLARRFQPTVLYGFDPHPDVPERSMYDLELAANGHKVATRIRLERQAAWTHDGELDVHVPEPRLALRTTVVPERVPTLLRRHRVTSVPCFDLAEFIGNLSYDRVVLKLDVEGAEYALLEHLIERRVDERVALVLVEWHALPGTDWELRRDSITVSLRCPVEDW